MGKFQSDRLNPKKPSVVKPYDDGLWWAQVQTPMGRLLTKVYHSHEEALAKANEYAAVMAQEEPA